ncbi:MAG: hypothetical protein IPK29_08000 [Betaproteobacteria bacterium]|nr:hypothetical protein [Betaproteobacteria bacterium]
MLVASQLASVLASWFSTMLMKPRRLPRMDFSLGLPPGVRTLVVVPTLLGRAKNVDDLLETLEVRFLGNQDDRLHFGLLTDLCDAQQETLAGDAALLARARDGIEALNDKYPGRDGDRFYLFHRPRRWNPVEQVWMGYERKRGKLAELNAVLRGAAHERFSLIVGDLGLLSEVRYVITLDTDTQLPRDSARQFVAAMAHPLHQPRFDPARKVVCAGYGILQPCMAASLGGPNQSLYAQLYGSETGIDPYTRSVSDAYQDMFREGSFIGKGIYDVDAFESALKERLPENRILSHDLLEGCHARYGLISDAYLYEEYPSRYQADVDRQMRWIRGDWQLLAWLLPRVPGPRGVRVPNPLSALSRWKIFDNLRRSLVPSSLLLLLLLGWGLAPHAGEWTLAVLGVFLIPPALAAIANAFRRPNDVGRSTHLGVVLRSTLRNFAQAGFRVACLPHEAMFSLRAILRTPVAHAVLASWPAGVARLRRSRLRRGQRPARTVALHVVGAVPRRACRDRPGLVAHAGPVCGGAGAAVVAGGADDRLVGQPAPGSPQGAAVRCAGPVPAQDGAQDLGILRALRGRRGSLAAPRQFPGAPRPGHRAPHFADQHRAGAAGQSVGLRLRLPLAGTAAGAHRRHVSHPGPARALSRAFLQLVRHREPAAAAAALCLLGGQRQPVRPPADAARRAVRAARPARGCRATVRGAGRHAGDRRRRALAGSGCRWRACGNR